MTLFILAIAVVFIATGTCALVEAALYAVRRTYIAQLEEAGHRSGKYLQRYKEKMDYPVTAILVFDTLLGVGGAAIAGSQARALFGPTFVVWFTLAMSALLLVFAQIIPKLIGVAYSGPIARYSAIPIAIAIASLYPVVRAIEFFTRHLKPGQPARRATEEDVRQMTRISVKEGSILGLEAELIQNSLKLNDVRADQIMTPRDQVTCLASNLTIAEAFKAFRRNSHSRIPVYDPANTNRWTGLVFSRDILFAMANDRHLQACTEIARPLHFVPAEISGDQLLGVFLKRRSHLFAVKESNGNPIGVVTLEDVVEEILGKEIVDEKETVD